MTFVYNLVTFVFGSDIRWKWNGVTGVIIKVNLIKNDTLRVRIINPIESVWNFPFPLIPFISVET